MGTTKDWIPEYWCDGKKVRASQIRNITPIRQIFANGEERTLLADLVLDHGVVEVIAAYLIWYKPEPGGYYVAGSDGNSYATAEKFEARFKPASPSVSLKPCLYNVQFVKM